MRFQLLVILGLVFVGADSIGEASLPKLKSKLIVVGDSIGGVKLGGTFKAAKAAWGKGGKCINQFGSKNCTYASKSRADGEARYSGAPSGKVTEITITAGSNNTNAPVYTTALAKLKTSKGIHIGSTADAVRKAYPKAKYRTIPMGIGKEFYLKGPGRASTEFQTSAGNDERVQFITMTTPR